MRKFVCNDKNTVVNTKQGKLRGFKTGDLYCFFGVDYAYADRFEEPKEVEHWDGIKDALNYGYVCPLLFQDVADKELLVPHRYWLMDEHCQNLNVWTTSLDKNAKKPVMVWFHGGAYTAGSAIEHICYEGDNLAEYGDVVVVSINHRLNVLGYCDLSSLGEEYKNSANLGNMDIVASLKWVHDNIENFGGDPGNVTIFGQSGGGWKVSDMMNTPEADGLYHKCIIESGQSELAVYEDDGSALVQEMLKALGEGKTIEDLKKVPFAELTRVYQTAVKAVVGKGLYIGSAPRKNYWFLGSPKDYGFSEYGKTVPVLIGTAMGEFNFERGVENKYDLTEEEQIALVTKKYGKYTDEVLAEFKKAFPGKNLTDALYIDQFFRVPSKKFIAKRIEEGCAPTYCYEFTYDFPLDGGKVAYHCSEIPFAFHNLEKTRLYHVEGETDVLEQQICDTFLNFAKTGVAKADNLPEWPACSAEGEYTMIWDTKCEVRKNFDDALLEVLKKTDTAVKLPGESMILPPDQLAVKVVH
mgnify:CR=1 FL=1